MTHIQVHGPFIPGVTDHKRKPENEEEVWRSRFPLFWKAYGSLVIGLPFLGRLIYPGIPALILYGTEQTPYLLKLVRKIIGRVIWALGFTAAVVLTLCMAAFAAFVLFSTPTAIDLFLSAPIAIRLGILVVAIIAIWHLWKDGLKAIGLELAFLFNIKLKRGNA